MTEYLFHWWHPGAAHSVTPSVKLEARSHLHGAALALRQFVERGCDINAPLAHVDITESSGGKQTLLVEEVLDWLNEPEQTEFIHCEGLTALVSSGAHHVSVKLNNAVSARTLKT